MSCTGAGRRKAWNAFFEVGIWLLFFALLVPSGVVGYAIGRSASDPETSARTPAAAAAGTAASRTPWSLQNGDVFNTRETHNASITSANVSNLGVVWTMPLTAISIYGTFAANPVTDSSGVVYLQDLDSNVFAVDLATGRVLWRQMYKSQDIGPNGVAVAGGTVYGATAKFAFALDAKTGKELWRNTKLVPKLLQKGGGELASGFGIDIQPQVANGKVYLSSAALLGVESSMRSMPGPDESSGPSTR
jgi:outer membrane protein assembly factor BamB